MEPIEVQMARFQEQLKTVINELERSNKGRESTDVKIEKISDTVESLHRRMEKVEEQMTNNAPTIQEFITIKHKVQGAGLAGRWVWAVGGSVISLLFAFREQIRDFILK